MNDPAPRQLGFVLIPRFNMTALTATLEPLRIANYISGRPLYAWRFLSPGGQTMTASNGMELGTAPLPRTSDLDAAFVCGSWNAQHHEDAALLGWLRRQDRAGVALGAMDIGTWILARAGLLDGHRATIHWYAIHAFAEAFPAITVSEQLFVTDRNRTTIAGGIAGLDAMLADVRARHGDQLALEIADQVMHHPVREATAPQRTALGGRREVAHPLLRRAVAMMEQHLEEPLAIPVIAARLKVSQRKLERLFRAHTGTSAVGHYRMLRLELARVMLTHTALPVRDVALACGFSSLSHFAKSFSAQFGKRPRDYREAWPDDASVPLWPGVTAGLMERAGKRG